MICVEYLLVLVSQDRIRCLQDEWRNLNEGLHGVALVIMLTGGKSTS